MIYERLNDIKCYSERVIQSLKVSILFPTEVSSLKLILTPWIQNIKSKELLMYHKLHCYVVHRKNFNEEIVLH